MENAIWEFLEGVIDPMQAMVLVALILGNLFTGVFSSMLNGTFEVGRLWEFVKRIGLVFVVYIGVGIVAQVIVDFQAIQTTVWAFLILQLTDKIFQNLRKWGLPVPDGLPIINTIMRLPAKMRKASKGPL